MLGYIICAPIAIWHFALYQWLQLRKVCSILGRKRGEGGAFHTWGVEGGAFTQFAGGSPAVH